MTAGTVDRADPSPLWQPRSDCGTECLPGPDRTPRVPWPHRAARLTALAGTLLAGGCLLVVLPLLPSAGRHAAGRRWARAVLAAVGVSLVCAGRPPWVGGAGPGGRGLRCAAPAGGPADRRALLVANHISWLDILAILAVSPARLLAKHEVRRWPLIGGLAAAGGTIFVRRDRPLALPATVAEVAGALRAGAVVAVFPEGTTWCGERTGPAGCGGGGRFRPAMFQAAVDARAPVVPLSISYRLGPGATTAAAFLGRDSLWTSLRRVVAVRGLVVSLVAGEPLHADPHPDPHPHLRAHPRTARRDLAGRAESAVQDGSGPPLSEFSGTAQPIRSGAAHDGTHGGTTDRGTASRRGRRSQHSGTALRQPALRRLRRRHGDQRQRGR